jgi:hypothetical protein
MNKEIRATADKKTVSLKEGDDSMAKTNKKSRWLKLRMTGLAGTLLN